MTASRIMGDSITMGSIPLDVQIVAVYDDGSLGVETAASLEARFPHARYGQVWVDVTGANPAAQVRDWETGDKAGSLQQWVIDHNAATGRKDAVVYCNRATIPQVRADTGSQVLGADYFLWVATLDGTVVAPGAEHLDAAPYTYPGVVAVQLKGAGLTGGDWDQSLVFDPAIWVPVPPAVPLPGRAQALAAIAGIQRSLAVLTKAAGQLPD